MCGTMFMMDVRTFLSDRSSRCWRIRVILIALLMLAFGLRLHDLGAKSLWSDEGLTLRRAEQPIALVFKNVNLIPIGPDYQDGAELEVVSTPDLHPPLYFLLMHVWIRWTGKSEFLLRFPSLVAATLSLPLLYVLGRSLMSREAGLWAALLGATSPFFLWYAQEARMYSWLVVLSLASVYAFLSLLKDRPRRREYVVFVVVTLALLYTHYAGFLLLAFEALAYAMLRLRTRRREVLITLGVVAAALIPLAPFAWRALHVRAFSFTHRPLLSILREASSSFSLGPSPSAVQPLWLLSPFLLFLGVGVLMLDVVNRRRAWVIGLGYLILPILIQFGLSFVKPNYMNPRHLMTVAPAWELMVAQGLTTLRRRCWPALVIALSFALFFRGQANHDILTSHRFWKDDIRGAVQYIEARARPGDAIVLHHPVIRLTFDYYYRGSCPEIVIPGYGNNDDTEQARRRFAEWAQRYDRIWFLYGPPPTYFPREFLPEWADTHLFKVDQQEFEAWWTYVGVAAYDDGAPALEEMPGNLELVDETWDSLHLIGFRAQEAAAGDNAWVDLYWQVEGEAPDEPLTLKLQLRDEAETVWVERAGEVLPFYTPAAWPTDRVVHTEFRLPLPDDTPPITYHTELQVIGLGGSRTVGELRVVRPVLDDSTPRTRARFEGGIKLLSGELESDRFRAGLPLLGFLTWEADASPGEDLRLRVRLVDQRGRVMVTGEMAPSAAGFPTTAWRRGDRMGGRLQLPLPPDLEGGRYRVQISLTEAQSGQVVPIRHWYGRRDWLTLGSVQVEAWPLRTELPEEVEHRLEDVEIASEIRLLGYESAREQQALNITLYWRAEEPIEEDYHVFVHIGLPDQPPLAEAGGVPVSWTRPTTSWRTGEIVVDEYALSLETVPPGQYVLTAGLYEPDTGQRPETVVNGNLIPGGYVVLEEVEVE